MSRNAGADTREASRLRTVLRKARLFDALDDAEIAQLAPLGEERSFEANEAVFREYESADSLFVVLEGRVSTVLRERGLQRELAQHAEGDHFARVVLREGQVCYVSAIALRGGSAFVLSSMGCAALLARTPRAGAPAQSETRAIIGPRADRRSDSGRGEPGEAADPSGSNPAPDAARIRSISAAVAGVAHEINTPLGVIENAASFVSERLSSAAIESPVKDEHTAEMLAEVSEACHLIQKNVALAARLVRSFKSLSVGQLSEPREQADLMRVVNEVLKVFRCKTLSALPPAPNWQGPHGSSGQHRLFLAPARVRITVECGLLEEERMWTGYPGLFSRVLLNLLTNIDRYAYPGGREGKVEITIGECDWADSKRGFQVVVRDFGAGIPPANLPRIFDPFFTTGRDRGGTGLGLAIVHNLVTQGLDGTVRVQSTLDQGTTFELRFPKVVSEHLPREVWQP